MKTTYQEVEITYDIGRSMFRAEGFRDKPTLQSMHDAIDRQIDGPSKPKFEHVTALYKYQYLWEVVTITGACEDGSLWIKKAEGKRRKLREFFVRDVKALTESNQAAAAEINRLIQANNAAHRRIMELELGMSKLTIPPTT